MPVQFDDYESQPGEVNWVPTEGSNAHTILSFLLEHPETGFTPSEIAEATGTPKGSVGPTLQRLESRDLVRHREPYWAAGTSERVAAYEAMLRSMDAIDAREDDEWVEVDRTEYEVDEGDLEAWRHQGDDE
jgi:DNA-binding transcriptional ArsR family regulator